MQDDKRYFGTVAEINAKLLYVTALAWSSYQIWPASPKWWGFGFLSTFAALGAVGLFINVIRIIYDRYDWDRKHASYLEKGNQPKTSALVSEEQRREAGMSDE